MRMKRAVSCVSSPGNAIERWSNDALFSPGRLRGRCVDPVRSHFRTAAWRPARRSGRGRRQPDRQCGRRHSRRHDQRRRGWRRGRRAAHRHLQPARQHDQSPARTRRRAWRRARRAQRRQRRPHLLGLLLARVAQPDFDSAGSFGGAAAGDRGLSARPLPGAGRRQSHHARPRPQRPASPQARADRDKSGRWVARPRRARRLPAHRRRAGRNARNPLGDVRRSQGHERAPGAGCDSPRRARAPGRFQPCLRAVRRSAPAGRSSAARRGAGASLGDSNRNDRRRRRRAPVAGPRERRAARFCRRPAAHRPRNGRRLPPGRRPGAVPRRGPWRATVRRRRLRRQPGRGLGDQHPARAELGRVEESGGDQHQPGRPQQQRAGRSHRRAARPRHPDRRRGRQRRAGRAAAISGILSRSCFGDRGRRAAAARSPRRARPRTSTSPHPART